MKVPFVSFAVAAIASPCDGFLSLPFINQANPALTEYAEAQENALLKIHFDIGEVRVKRGNPVVTGNRLGIDGLLVELHGKEDANYKHPSLPGANGPNPQLSTGAKTLELVKEGKFVDFTGSRSVSLEHGVWEIIWRRNAKAGSLICGFDVPEEVKRNDASIPKGRVYVTFPVWTQESLQDLLGRKVIAEEKAMEAMDRLKDENIKMEETTNLLMKAMHFRNACKAHEDFDYSGYSSYQSMPLERDMISLKNGLHMCSLGTVWTKKDGFFGGEHVLLGSASAEAGDRGELKEKKVVTERELKSVAFDGLRP
mmetsp:Transcript_20591/g.44724  ORF Transcript_20591/g.44724 Transcript_20591/m.44724 type:complete len:311 (+) Transcript_20591:364-1296(+)|eukprot:CAMPEP_0172310622 /NCGR_PEP_ID=MMETSP1058-20130122/12150_1 /TAXON_ID=83371 /ORGANISM="Detonula confervacea, Strain CCMP 353" /LENGTH=310 /DNA_ID=CAMNT_0013023509 /DNA_START=296 /DNA_END=1228 /DNA_ORIENTATION=+